MNAGEIDTFMARPAWFEAKGLLDAEGDGLADRLVLRDREGDDRRSCLECRHLQGAGVWRCGKWRAAGVALQTTDGALGRDFALLLQRCCGFLNVSQQQNREPT